MKAKDVKCIPWTSATYWTVHPPLRRLHPLPLASLRPASKAYTQQIRLLEALPGLTISVDDQIQRRNRTRNQTDRRTQLSNRALYYKTWRGMFKLEGKAAAGVG